VRIAKGKSAAPAWAQIEDELTRRIERGQLRVGDRLAPERELAAQLGVARSTVRQAVLALAARGLVERGVGRGTFVAAPKVEHDHRGRPLGLTAQLERAGLEPGAQVLHAATEPADDPTAAALGLAPGEDVVRVRRVRSGAGVPLTLEDSCFPAALVPGILRRDLTGSLYGLLGSAYGLRPERAVERLEPALAGAADARALGVAPGSPLMLVARTAYAADGTPVESARDRHRGDRAAFVVEVGPHG
jgi:GntR family transcriptional regulator